MTQVERNGESARHRVTFNTKPKKNKKNIYMEKASENQPLFSFSLFSPSGENFSTTFKYLETDLFRQRNFLVFSKKLNLSQRFHMH